MPTDLEAAMPALETETRSRLGDTVLYKGGNAAGFVEITAFFDPAPAFDMAGPAKIAQERPTLDISVSDWATHFGADTKPQTTDRCVVAARPHVYRPQTWLLDDEGQRWFIDLEIAK